jgi:hypothetical protein
MRLEGQREDGSVGGQVEGDGVGGKIRLEKTREVRRFGKGDVEAGEVNDDGEVGGEEI